MPLVEKYVSGLENADQLSDMVAAGQEDREARDERREFLYPEVNIAPYLL